MEIPGYKMLDTLGQGGMATVYLAIQESFERKVAVKVMSAQLAQDPAFGDRFQREAKIVSQMNHPNIVTVYDVGVVDNHHYLAMEYVDGRELRSCMGKLSLEEKIRVVKDIALALNYAGRKGYVHRDVKPDNVMISDEDGRSVLMDFGIAKASDANHSMTKTGMAIGTPYYMSPEQAQGQSVDSRSDIYSLGVMFFQLLTGYVPYDAESGVAIGIKHVTEPVPMLPKHLRIFQPILEKVMAKTPEKRYQSGAEFVEDLNKINISDLDQVDEIIKQEVNEARQTDPNAQTVVAQATPPSITGNVTTADAARAARLLSEKKNSEQQDQKKKSPLVALVLLALVFAAGWYYFQMQSSSGSQLTKSQQQAPVKQDVEPEALTEEAADKQWEMVIAESEEEVARKEAEEKARQEAEAKAAAAEQARLEAEAKAAAAEKARMEAEAKAKAEEQARIEAEAKAAAEARRKAAEEEARREAARKATEQVEREAAAARQAQQAKASLLSDIRQLIGRGELKAAAEKLREANNRFPNDIEVNELLALHQHKAAELEELKRAASNPAVTNMVVSETPIDNTRVAQKTSIPLNRNAYVGFSYKNFQGATTLLQAILYDSSRTVKIMHKPVVATGTSGEIFFTLARPVEGFPDGGYTVDLMSGEKRLGSVSFTVSH